MVYFSIINTFNKRETTYYLENINKQISEIENSDDLKEIWNNYQKKFKSNNNYEPKKLTYLKNLFLKKEKKPIIPIPEKDKKSYEYEEDTNKFIPKVQMNSNVSIETTIDGVNTVNSVTTDTVNNTNVVKQPPPQQKKNTGKTLILAEKL